MVGMHTQEQRCLAALAADNRPYCNGQVYIRFGHRCALHGLPKASETLSYQMDAKEQLRVELLLALKDPWDHAIKGAHDRFVLVHQGCRVVAQIRSI